MKIAFVLLITGMPLLTLANVTCSDTTGMTRYEFSQYEGGAYPQAGRQMSETQVYVQNVEVADMKTFFGAMRFARTCTTIILKS